MSLTHCMQLLEKHSTPCMSNNVEEQKCLSLILAGSVQGQNWCEIKWPDAGWLGTRCHPLRCYGAHAARWACLCAVSQHFSPPRTDSIWLGCGSVFGRGRRWANHRKWKWEGKSDGAAARCFVIPLVMKCCWCECRTRGARAAPLCVLRSEIRLRLLTLFPPWAAFMPPPVHNKDIQGTAWPVEIVVSY